MSGNDVGEVFNGSREKLHIARLIDLTLILHGGMAASSSVERSRRFRKRRLPEQTRFDASHIRHWLALCVVSRDAVSKLDWVGDGAERLEAFAGAMDRHVAIVEHAPQD